MSVPRTRSLVQARPSRPGRLSRIRSPATRQHPGVLECHALCRTAFASKNTLKSTIAPRQSPRIAGLATSPASSHRHRHRRLEPITENLTDANATDRSTVCPRVWGDRSVCAHLSTRAMDRTQQNESIGRVIFRCGGERMMRRCGYKTKGNSLFWPQVLLAQGNSLGAPLVRRC